MYGETRPNVIISLMSFTIIRTKSICECTVKIQMLKYKMLI